MEKQLNKTEVIAFISNTNDGIDWKRVVLTTVENVGKLKGGSALLYDPDRFSGRTWLNAEKHFMLYNMYSKKKLKEHAKLNGNRQKMSHQIWQLVKPHAVKPADKDLSSHYVHSPVKEDTPVVTESKPVKASVGINDESIIKATGKKAKSPTNNARHKLYKVTKVKEIIRRSKDTIKLADIKYDIKSGYAEIVG